MCLPSKNGPQFGNVGEQLGRLLRVLRLYSCIIVLFNASMIVMAVFYGVRTLRFLNLGQLATFECHPRFISTSQLK